MQHVDISKLDSIIDDESDSSAERILYRDVFAVACYLHSTGNQEASKKLLQTLFDHLGRNMRQTYLSKLASSLGGNEREYAIGISAHLEINKLFDQTARSDEQA